jgi:tRNA G46 methylase TrmB
MREFRPERLPRPNLIQPLPPQFDVEIGAGQGLHAIQYARANPERNLVAIERTHEKFAKLARRSARHPELKSLIPLHADAIAVLAHFVAPATLERVFLLYPNPYPKAKQANLRFHNSPFMGYLRTRLKPDAEFTMATNLKWYAEEAKATMPRWGFELRQERELKAGAHTPRTHFEKKYLERGETCFDLIFSVTMNEWSADSPS